MSQPDWKHPHVQEARAHLLLLMSLRTWRDTHAQQIAAQGDSGERYRRLAELFDGVALDVGALYVAAARAAKLDLDKSVITWLQGARARHESAGD